MDRMKLISNIFICQGEDVQVKIQTRLEGKMVWFIQAQSCERLLKLKLTISKYIKNIFQDDELVKDSVVRNLIQKNIY